MDERRALEGFLRTEIPLTRAMGLAVERADAERVVLAAPLEANVNDKQTAFGGSLAALLTLSAWSTLWLWRRRAGVACDIVVVTSRLDYRRPVRDVLRADCPCASEGVLKAARAALQRGERPRIPLRARVMTGAELAVTMDGEYALLEPRP